MSQQTRKLVSDIWHKGVQSVLGGNSVKRVIGETLISQPDKIIAIGKAASDMALGATQSFDQEIPTLVITKYDHTGQELRELPQATIIEASHPIPDENSLVAGRAALKAVADMQQNERLLLLISGGASSLVEVPNPGVTLDDIIALNRQMISKDYTIEKINSARRKYSQIKSGGLLSNFIGAHVDVILISDVKGDDPNVIGSGIGAYDVSQTNLDANTFIAANNTIARYTVAQYAQELGYPVTVNEESLYDDVESIAQNIKNKLHSGEQGIYIWGGEPTVNLPENPGNGGRNQALALMLAKEISGSMDIAIVVGGTDGTDGPTKAAGGVVDNTTFDPALKHDEFIKRADTGTALEAINALLVTGPTGTNVMDLIVAAKL